MTASVPGSSGNCSDPMTAGSSNKSSSSSSLSSNAMTTQQRAQSAAVRVRELLEYASIQCQKIMNAYTTTTTTTTTTSQQM